MGIPAVVGCGDAPQVLKEGGPVTVSCAEGDTGFVYQGALETEVVSSLIADAFDERDPAVKQMLHLAIQACRKAGKYGGICGQGPSDRPDLAKWLVDEGIESLSLNRDTVVGTWLYLAREGKAPGKS